MTPRNTLLLSAICFLALMSWVFMQHEREVGAMKALVHQSDSIAGVRRAEQVAAHDSAVGARADADKLRQVARREVKRDSVQHTKTDSTLRETSDERDRARQLLADSLASVHDLRDELARLVVRSVADSVGLVRERARHDTTIAAYVRSAVSDSTAIRRGIAAENAALARAVSAEHQVSLLRQQMPSAAGRWIERGVSLAAVVYFAGRK